MGTARNRRGFTLIELVVVVVIIAIIAAIAIPKMSRGSAARADSASRRTFPPSAAALELYQTEHGGTYPSSSTAATFVNQLTEYTDANGVAQSTKDTTHIYGPYIKAFPTLPVGTNKGLNTVTITGPAGTGQFGWYYDGTTVWANDPTTDQDVHQVSYSTY